jgi:hypothetical protein
MTEALRVCSKIEAYQHRVEFQKIIKRQLLSKAHVVVASSLLKTFYNGNKKVKKMVKNQFDQKNEQSDESFIEVEMDTLRFQFKDVLVATAIDFAIPEEKSEDIPSLLIRVHIEHDREYKLTDDGEFNFELNKEYTLKLRDFLNMHFPPSGKASRFKRGH